jgi:hypothetical protein
MYTGGDVSTYRIRHGSKYKREGADGRVSILAHAGAFATVDSPKVLTFVASASNPLVGVGYFATAWFTTVMTSATALHMVRGPAAYIGIPDQNVASDTDGWFQIAGPYTGVKPNTTGSISQDMCINAPIKWAGAGFDCSHSGSSILGYGASEGMVSGFAVSLSSISQGTYDWYLLGKKVCGIATA